MNQNFKVLSHTRVLQDEKVLKGQAVSFEFDTWHYLNCHQYIHIQIGVFNLQELVILLPMQGDIA